jgi:hypothetical protein
VRKLLLLVVGTTLVACTVTPRDTPPTAIGHANNGLQEASNCILTALNKTTAAQGELAITNSVKVMESGKVEEISGASAGVGELYVIRLTAENSGTKAEVRSVLRWSKFSPSKLDAPLSSCGVQH